MNSSKTDAEKQRYWQRTIRGAARSGVSIRELCGWRGLRESQFYPWRHRWGKPATTGHRQARRRQRAAGRSGKGHRSEAVQVSRRGGSPAHEKGLAFCRPLEDKPENDNGERHPHRIRQDDGELDLQGSAFRE